MQSHPLSRVYHTSAWIRIVAEIGRYTPLCTIARREDRVVGVSPAVEVRSRLTGNRMCILSFSDDCSVLADEADVAESLLVHARSLRDTRGLGSIEMRGAPAIATASGVTGDEIARRCHFSRRDHFDTFVLPLSPDATEVMGRLHKKAVRPTIKRAFALGVTVREGKGPSDLRSFYRMYCLTRRRHGVPPQPIALFERIVERLDSDPRATLYLAEHGGRSVGAIIVIRHRATMYLKYEVVDDSARELRPVYAMLWRSIEDACAAGCTTYDFGRTERNNEGLASFKSRWGTERIELPYYFDPPGEAVSVVDPSSFKYRVFTAVFRHAPIGASSWIGSRIFRHFG